MKIDYSLSWILQKVLAIIFLLALIYVCISLVDISLQNHSEVTTWFYNKLNFTVFLILFTSIVLHSSIGLNSIIDDYIHDVRNKKKIKLLKNTFLMIIYLITLISLISL